jgi:hypothetical protein
MPALIGGAVFGVVASLPVVGALNCLCCSLIIGAGFLAAFLYSRECAKTGTEFRAGGGAKVGVVSGLFYAIVATIVGAGVRFLMADYTASQVEQAMAQFENNPDMPAEVADQIVGIIEMMSAPVSVPLVGINLVTGLIFATIGGLIGGAVFKVQAQPPAAAAPPTTTPEPPTV